MTVETVPADRATGMPKNSWGQPPLRRSDQGLREPGGHGNCRPRPHKSGDRLRGVRSHRRTERLRQEHAVVAGGRPCAGNDGPNHDRWGRDQAAAPDGRRRLPNRFAAVLAHDRRQYSAADRDQRVEKARLPAPELCSSLRRSASPGLAGNIRASFPAACVSAPRSAAPSFSSPDCS